MYLNININININYFTFDLVLNIIVFFTQSIFISSISNIVPQNETHILNCNQFYYDKKSTELFDLINLKLI